MAGEISVTERSRIIRTNRPVWPLKVCKIRLYSCNQSQFYMISCFSTDIIIKVVTPVSLRVCVM